MLVKIQDLGEEYKQRFQRIVHWPEVSFDAEDAKNLKILPMINEVQKSSLLYRNGDTHAYFPSQYVLYAVLIKEFAENLYKHTRIIQNLKDSPLSNAAIHQLIKSRDASNPEIIKLSHVEQQYFFDLFGTDSTHALTAKSILSENRGVTGLRGEGDFFTSVILKVINVPDVTSSYLGKFIYELCQFPEVYQRLQHKFLSDVPNLVYGSVIGTFANAVFRFIWHYDRFGNLHELIKENNDSRFLSIDSQDNHLTSVFRTSDNWLKESDLESGGKARFAATPSFKFNGNLIYISTEWTVGKDSRLDLESLKIIIEKCYPELIIEINDNSFSLRPRKGQKVNASPLSIIGIHIPKPFLLLAGISGTGKTQFVRHQAASQGVNGSNYALIPVRPDWNEPSDLLGYVSRIGGERYIPTPFLKFIAKAWCQALEGIDSQKIVLRPLNNICTYWACLDEMNLAPVEQYFADYLSVLETRKWEGDSYECDAIVHPAKLLHDPGSLITLQKELGLEGQQLLWDYFVANGIPLPPNLIVAGTVNMDETTHGFSRKVIDRAFTIDFGEFFPNDFDLFFAPTTTAKTLKFSRYSSVSKADLANVAADTDGLKSIGFLKEINELLRSTPYELAFRALNELLLAVKCFAPADENTLFAVWDDFLMSKVLPRIEGDAEKLKFDGIDKSLLTELREKVKGMLTPADVSGLRPDLLRTSMNGSVISVHMRSLKKIDWMQDRLKENSFTGFWP